MDFLSTANMMRMEIITTTQVEQRHLRTTDLISKGLHLQSEKDLQLALMATVHRSTCAEGP